MDSKQYIVVLAAVIFSFMIAAPAQSAGLNGFNPAKIVKIEKIKRWPVIKPLFSKRFQEKATDVVRAPVVYIENSPLADSYREQPLLFSIVAVIITGTLAVLAFIFHIIRSDPRYYY